MLLMGGSSSVCQLPIAWGRDEPAALDQLTPLVYRELHKLARAYLRWGRPGQSLQATAPIDEAYLRLPDQAQPVQWENRAHFFGIAARLAAVDERKAKVIELRYFGGLSVEETAEGMGLSARTVKGEWAMAKGWLKSQLGPREGM
jgi:RNA polymerase sigma factor (sigma-70 family)